MSGERAMERYWKRKMQDLQKMNKALWQGEKKRFRNYRQALAFLFADIYKKKILPNYEPTYQDWALYTLFSSKAFQKKWHGSRLIGRRK